MKFLQLIFAVCGLSAIPAAANAQTDEWFVGSHPDYHAAMVREIDDIFVAIYVTKEPSKYLSPLLIETMAPSCDTKKPVTLHSTEAIMAFGQTAEERLVQVKSVVQAFYDKNVNKCGVSDDLEARLFYRFDDAYMATDELLLDAGIFPLDEIGITGGMIGPLTTTESD